MSEFKFSPNLFLEKVELDRWKKFLVDDGFKANLLANSDTFGLIRKENSLALTPFVNALVEEDTSLTIKIREITAIDKNGNLIYSKALSQLAIPISATHWYWIKITHAFSTIEKGTF